MHEIDLDAYFARIGYSGFSSPTLETLRHLVVLHPTSIAFENLDPLMKRPIRLDLHSLEQKLVNEHRGGYCYVRIPTNATTHSNGSRPDIPIDRDQCGAGADSAVG